MAVLLVLIRAEPAPGLPGTAVLIPRSNEVPLPPILDTVLAIVFFLNTITIQYYLVKEKNSYSVIVSFLSLIPLAVMFSHFMKIREFYLVQQYMNMFSEADYEDFYKIDYFDVVFSSVFVVVSIIITFALKKRFTKKVI